MRSIFGMYHFGYFPGKPAADHVPETTIPRLGRYVGELTRMVSRVRRPKGLVLASHLMSWCSKAIQVWDSNARAMGLHPDIGASFAPKLLLYAAFCDPKGHGALEEHFLLLLCRLWLLLRLFTVYFDWHAKVKAAFQPLVLGVDAHGVLGAQSQMVPGDGGYRVALAPELRPKGVFGLELPVAVNDIVCLVDSPVVVDRLGIEKLYLGRHDIISCTTLLL